MVIDNLKADAVALQEAALCSKGDKTPCLRDLERATGMNAVPGITFRRKGKHFGNVLLSPHPFKSARIMDLSVHNREPRIAILATLDYRGTPIRIIATHLGLGSGERRKQIKRLLERIDKFSDKITILMGDLNEWNPLSLAETGLRRHFGHIWSPPSFPSRSPILSLDRILVKPRKARRRIAVVRPPPAECASDHLPVIAAIDPFL